MHQLDVGPCSAVSSLRRAVRPVRDQPQLAQENGEVEQTCRQIPKCRCHLVALASQKSGMMLHFLSFYGHPTLSTWFTSGYGKSGKKLDMGKGCVRFKSLEDLALDLVGRTIARVSAAEHITNYQAARALLGKGKSSRKKDAKSSVVKKAQAKN